MNHFLHPAAAARTTAACGLFSLALLLAAAQPLAAQSSSPDSSPAASQPSPRSPEERAGEAGELPNANPAAPMTLEQRRTQTEQIMEQFQQAVPEEIYQEGVEAVAAFEKQAEALEQTVLEMRRRHTRLANGFNVGRDAYLEQRDQSRQLINATYQAALDVLDYVPHPDATRFVVTVIEQRNKQDVYDEATLEGAAKLLDLGVRWVYVAQAAARSAIAVGDFELAERLYEKLNEDELTDTDKRLIVQTEQIKQQFEAEQKLREQRDGGDGELPKVVFHTTRGDFTVELYIDEAPSTVSHFIQLVESGFYDGLDFFQVIEGLLALTGDPLGDGSSRPDRYLADEHGGDNVRMPLTGSLVMAKLPMAGGREFVPDSAGTQFAILYLPLPAITEHQTVFGRVIEGLDVVGSFRRVDPQKKKDKGEIVLPPDRIVSAEVIDRPEQLPEVQYADPPIEPPQ
jgi:peptidylprolyl isomerase